MSLEYPTLDEYIMSYTNSQDFFKREPEKFCLNGMFFDSVFELAEYIYWKDIDKNIEKFDDITDIYSFVTNKFTDYYMPLFLTSIGFPFLNSDLSDTSDEGLIRFFHKSIYLASRGNKISPYDAWFDKDLVEIVAKNRLKYVGNCLPTTITKGFNISKVAPKVSVFTPARAEKLINQYLNTSTLIVDPFSGFSGRLLGAARCNKKYVGYDINKDHVFESNGIIEFKGLQKTCSVIVQDLLEFKGKDWSKEGLACLFTCSPYSDKETWNENEVYHTCDEWIDIVLDKHKGCRKYLFVVDETEKYKDNIVQELKNKSHFGTNYEKVVLIKAD